VRTDSLDSFRLRVAPEADGGPRPDSAASAPSASGSGNVAPTVLAAGVRVRAIDHEQRRAVRLFILFPARVLP
jgi:hypothetical protein